MSTPQRITAKTASMFHRRRFLKASFPVARLVMEKTPHVMLVGEGALQFALANGFQKENLLTPIGAGLYVDGDVGAATSSGLGEDVIRTCVS
jgi:isoaspartyl peptidase/L-asparaginase-like protein (Ntn-hydrolase superfamily)